MLRNVTSLGVAFSEAHGRLETLIDNDIPLLEFLEICANNHIHITATYLGVKDE